MRRRLDGILAGLIAACAAAGCAPRITVSVERAADVDFSSFETWDWAQPRDGSAAPGQAGGEEGRRLRAGVGAAIEAGLAERGYERSAGDPDFLVGYHVTTEDVVQAWTIDDYYGYERFQRPGYRFYADRSHRYPLGTGDGERRVVYEYGRGSLVIDISTPAEQRLVWRAWAGTTFDPDERIEARERRLRKAVRKLLEDFAQRPQPGSSRSQSSPAIHHRPPLETSWNPLTPREYGSASGSPRRDS